MAKLFNSIEYRQGLLELDLQYIDLGVGSAASLAHLLLAVKSLKRFTFISDASSSCYVDLGATIVASLQSNQNNCQLDSLVLYGLDLSAFEVGRSLSWFVGRQQRLKVLRVQECNLQGKALFALLSSIRKSRSIQSIEKLMISLNAMDTQESIVTLCGLVKEASQLRSLCTFFTGVII